MKKIVGVTVLAFASLAVSHALWGNDLRGPFSFSRTAYAGPHGANLDVVVELDEVVRLVELEQLEALAELEQLEDLGRLVEIRQVVAEAREVRANVGEAQEGERFQWTGTLADGQVIEVRGVNGDIVAEGYDGSDVVVEAVKSGRKHDPSTVRIEVVEYEGGVTLCAVYPGRKNRCEPGGGTMKVDRNDVRVDFHVKVPRGLDFTGATVNGDVHADALPGNAKAVTVNGDVDLVALGFAAARTVNGGIRVSMGALPESGELEFETVNGDITLTLPAESNADFEASWLNGKLTSDLPVNFQGRAPARKAAGIFGEGGVDLDVKTVNGSIRLHTGQD